MRALMIMVMLMVGVSVAAAQDAPVCPTADQLTAAIAACDGLDTNEACFGAAAQAGLRQPDLSFSQPGDRLHVGAFDWLAVNADGAAQLALPATRADEALSLLLVGGARLENASSAGVTLDVWTNGRARLRAVPDDSDDSTIVTTFEAGVALTALGRNEAGDWIFVRQGDFSGWMAAFLLRGNNFDQLTAVTPGEGTALYAPMQAMNLVPSESPSCGEALPAGALLYSAERASVLLNGVNVTFSGTLFGQIVEQVGRPALRLDLLSGSGVVQAAAGSVFMPPGTQTLVVLDPTFGVALAEPFPLTAAAAGYDTTFAPLVALLPDADGVTLSPPLANSSAIQAAATALFAPDGLFAGMYSLVDMRMTEFDASSPGLCSQDRTVGMTMATGPAVADFLEATYGVRIVPGVSLNGASLTDHNDPQWRTVPETAGWVGINTLQVTSATEFMVIETFAYRTGEDFASCSNTLMWRWVGP